ncbi:MFS transporter [Nitrospirillum pindoramense]|uniref:ACS family hexuronate transporter-like MFS transporter n=1 Tax=Nitrospirillum amazonense TaxID=28077 RepID=A0A560H0D4_9PROT|nr:MFS transporter [Nitrospirillum amazonense]TWB39581.1 ACS family hexuronate transporter-like MFS transporter [Nitrospirillum amazonense]
MAWPAEATIAPSPPPARIGRRRWIVVALLFAATVINYVDRQMLGLLKPLLSREFHWSETDYADIIFWFQASYAVAYLVCGRIIDRIGARWGYALTFVIWNLAHIAHGLASGLVQFVLVRMALGAGEAGNFPAGLKSVAEWFPRRERALAVGVFNAGSNVGAVITPLVVPALVAVADWRMAFMVTGVVSFAWLAAWLIFYRRPEEDRRLSAAERAHILSDAITPTVSASGPRLAWILRQRQTWAYVLAKFLTDPIWWVFLFWLPDFLGRRFGLDLRGFGPPLVAIYLMSDIGSVAGGWLSSRLMRRGLGANRARKVAMLMCAACVIPVLTAPWVGGLTAAVLIIGLATAGHQGFSANLMTLPSDLFPPSAVATVVGLGGTAGAVGGMLMAKFTGWILQGTGSYGPVFLTAALAYPLALLAIQALSPNLRPAMPDATGGGAPS